MRSRPALRSSTSRTRPGRRGRGAAARNRAARCDPRARGRGRARPARGADALERVPDPARGGRGAGEPASRVPDGAVGDGLEPVDDRLLGGDLLAASAAAAAGSVPSAVLLIAGVGLGSLTWDVTLASGTALVGRATGERLLRVVDLVAGIGLICFGAALAYSVLSN